MAIARDTATNLGNATGTSLTASHTCTGSDRILFVHTRIGGTTDIITGVTYAGIAMTKINGVYGTNNLGTALYYLIAPATGANDVVISTSGSVSILAVAASYTGAKQTGQPDASNTNSSGSTTGLTTSVTTVADNSWGIMAVNTAAGNTVASTGSVLRQQGDNSGIVLFDTNADLTPPGSKSMAFTCDSGSAAVCMASFSPISVQNLTITAATGTFVLTGVAANIGYLYTLAVSVGSFILTGIDVALRFTGWTNQSKNNSSWTNQSRNSSTFTNQTKN